MLLSERPHGHLLRCSLGCPVFPVALGVIRDVDAPTYDDSVTAQIEEVKTTKKYHNIAELLETNDIWEVK